MRGRLQPVCSARLGWVGRYFLRRLALARRDSKSSEGTAYARARFEVTLVVVLAPCMAIFSCVLVASLKWAPGFGRVHNFSPKLAALVIAALAGSVGSAWFSRHFRTLGQSGAWADFDTERDRRIAFWQKVAIMSVCGAVIPLLAIMVTFSIL